MLNPRSSPTAAMDTATMNTVESKSTSERLPEAASSIDSNSSFSWRHVYFSDGENDTQRSVTHKELTPDMIQELWYSQDDIERMKNEVRCLVCKQRQIMNTSAREATNDNSSMSTTSNLQRYGAQRSKYRRDTLQSILNAQNQNRDPEFLRQVSEQCTAWARALAANQGLEDYCEVYDPLDSLIGSAKDSENEGWWTAECCPKRRRLCR